VFAEIVSGRVKAKLDANHETLQKYGKLIDKITIVPYMFNNVRQKALALRIGDNSIGVGEIAQAELSYSGAHTNYPVLANDTDVLHVKQRDLPSVDKFVYNIYQKNLDLVEKSNEATWSNLFIMQSEIGAFKGDADVSNSFYDYRRFKPVGRMKADVNLSNGNAGFDTWTSVYGEATKLEVAAIPDGTDTTFVYRIWVIIDSHFRGGSPLTIGVVPLAIILPTQTIGAPVVTFNLGGKRVLSSDVGMYVNFALEGQQMGWAKSHDSVPEPSGDVLWSTPVEITIGVNNVLGGITSPFGTVEKKAVESLEITALPYSGYALDYWNVDNGNAGVDNPITIDCYKDRSVIAYFIHGNVIVFRPNGNGIKIELSTNKVGIQNWDCVDDVTANDDVDFVWTGISGEWKSDVYTLRSYSGDIPVNALIQYVEVFTKVKSNISPEHNHIKLLMNILGTVYEEAPIQLRNDESWEILHKTYDKNPLTNATWLRSEVASLGAGISLQRVDRVHGDGKFCYCTQLYVHIGYTT
jgi:hypothetical protein